MLLKRQTKPHILIISAFLATFCQGLTEITTDESQNAKVIYNSAINTLKDKYYLKSKIDLLDSQNIIGSFKLPETNITNIFICSNPTTFQK